MIIGHDLKVLRKKYIKSLLYGKPKTPQKIKKYKKSKPKKNP
jgi:hypothetical protein